MKIRVTAKRFVAGAIIAALVAQIVIIPAKFSFAASGLDNTDYVAKIANVMRMMNDAAKMQLLTQKMKSCLSVESRGRLNRSDNPFTGFSVENALIWDNGYIWKPHWNWIQDTDIGVGYYLEEIVGAHGSQDGAISCGEGNGGYENGLFHTFVNMLEAEGVVSGNAPWRQVICNKDDSSLAGILTRDGWSSNSPIACDTGAKAGGGTASFARVNTDYAFAYLEKLYNAWINNYKDDNGNVVGNRYAVPFANIDDYGGTASRQVGATAYFLWSKEISVFCAGRSPSASTKFNIDSLEARSGDPKFSTKLVWIGTEADEGAATREVTVKAEGKGGSGGKQSSSFGANTRTCNELIDAANAAVGNVQAEYREILTGLCREEIARQIVEARATLAARYPDGEEYSEADAAAVAEMEAFERQSGTDKYIVDQRNSTAPAPNNAGGWQCVDSEQLTFLTQIEQGEYGNDDENNSTGGTPGAGENSCFTRAGALGWILCPILDGLGNAVTGIYEDIIQPFLRIDATLLSDSGSGSGTFGAWQIFQSIANIMFIILLLVVIFSQLTGVGIDNYGIKKILPKLIIAAVLINLSYIICQLAVDLSNILGYGLKSILDNMANGVQLPSTIDVNGSVGEVSSGATVFTGLVGVLAIGLGAGALLSAGFAVILPVLLGLLGALIAIFFTFVLLGVRQAGVVILVVVAPLAFAFYMLPNTKKLFDRWLKMFQGLLIFFPICGLLMGAGNLTAVILLSTGGAQTNFFVALIAMLLPVVPFFFLPALLKASFAAMGNIGARISGFGKSFNKGLTGKVRGSEAYKDKYAKMAAGKAGGARERFLSSRLGGLAIGGKSGMARNRAAYLKKQREDAAVNNMMGSGFSAAMAKQESDVNKEQLENEMALMKEDTHNFDVDKMTGDLDTLMRKTSLTGQEELRAKALMKKLSTSGGYGQKGLAKTVGGSDVSVANRKLAAKMLSTDADVGGAIAKKDGAAAQYLREINSGATTAATLNDWKSDTRVVNGTTMSNAQFVMSNVLTDDNDFAGQSAGVVTDALSSGLVDNTRLQRMIDNERLMQSADGDVVQALQAEATARGITTTTQATQAAQTAQQGAVFNVQQQQLQATHEQNALNRGTETIYVGGAITGTPVTGYAPPAGFDVSVASNVSTNTSGERIVTNADGKKWNINKGRYES
jgi:hypothetical protein